MFWNLNLRLNLYLNLNLNLNLSLNLNLNLRPNYYLHFCGQLTIHESDIYEYSRVFFTSFR